LSIIRSVPVLVSVTEKSRSMLERKPIPRGNKPLKKTELKRSELAPVYDLSAYRKRIKKIGKKKQREIKDFGHWRSEYLRAHPQCEIGLRLAQDIE
jgi:hypothetical protein